MPGAIAVSGVNGRQIITMDDLTIRFVTYLADHW